MNIKINFKNRVSDKSTGNLILFVDEKLNITGLKKVLSKNEYSYISDLIKLEDQKKKILIFDISSKKKIILISVTKNITSADIENLGAKFYDTLKEFNRFAQGVANATGKSAKIVADTMAAVVTDVQNFGNVTDEEAAFTVIGAIGLQGIRLLNPTFGETIVVESSKDKNDHIPSSPRLKNHLS